MTSTEAPLDRIERFLTSFYEQLASDVLEWPGGVAYVARDMPQVWDINVLDLRTTQLRAEEIAAYADDLLGSAGCIHRRVRVTDAELGAHLEPAFKKLGWEHDVHAVMLHTGEPNRVLDTSIVEELGSATWDARAEQMRSYPMVEDDDTVRQLKMLYDRMLEVGNGRDFAVKEDGKVVSFALLYSSGRLGQIEDVATLEAYRQRGYSSRVVAKALEESRNAHELTFLIADDDDWPKDFYGRMGFEVIGRYHFFLKRPPDAKKAG